LPGAGRSERADQTLFLHICDRRSTVKHTLYLMLGAALLISAPVCAESSYPGPSAELSSGAMRDGAIAPPSQAQRKEALAAANIPAPNGPSNVIPNGPATANPPGAGASSQATLTEHGEVGTTASSNTSVTSNLAANR
jgi:hypothetical protein